MASKKEQRRLAIEREKQRRYSEALSDCPISRDEYDAMIDYVSDRIVEDGHTHDFSITTAYLESKGAPVRAVLDFLRERKMADDWALFVSGDPYMLFGPKDGRNARMPIEEADLSALLLCVDAAVRKNGCDHSHKLTRSWLREHGLDEIRVTGALLARGGGCDCEVVLNIDPEYIYTHDNSEQAGGDQPATRRGVDA